MEKRVLIWLTLLVFEVYLAIQFHHTTRLWDAPSRVLLGHQEAPNTRNPWDTFSALQDHAYNTTASTYEKVITSVSREPKPRLERPQEAEEVVSTVSPEPHPPRPVEPEEEKEKVIDSLSAEGESRPEEPEEATFILQRASKEEEVEAKLRKLQPRRRVEVVVWTKVQNWVGFFDNDNPKKARQMCSTECIFTTDKGRLAMADGVVIHHLTQRPYYDFPPNKPKGQKWIWMNRESPLRLHSTIFDPEYVKRFDMTMTYELTSSIPLLCSPSLHGAHFYTDVTPLGFHEKDGYGQGDAAVAVFSHCIGDKAEGRMQYVKELSKHMHIHSYGKCLHNREEPQEIKSITNWRERKWSFLRRYKFYLAFESVSMPDYTSEKVYDGLLAGSLPVYYGNPNVTLLVPPHSIIRAADFPSPKALADFLKELAHDPDRYESYFQWKYQPPTKQFQWALDHSGMRHTSMCKVCEALAAGQGGSPIDSLMYTDEMIRQHIKDKEAGRVR